MPRPISDKPIRSEVRANLESRCRSCEHCHGEGLVPIFHDRYEGMPYVCLKRRDGTVRSYAMRTSVPCVCPLGQWFQDARDSGDATAVRVALVTLQQVLEGRVRWSKKDPTLPKYDPSEVVKPGDFRRMLDGLSKTVNRAKDVLRQPAPAAPSWKSLPPAPNVRELAPAVTVPDECEEEIPF